MLGFLPLCGGDVGSRGHGLPADVPVAHAIVLDLHDPFCLELHLLHLLDEGCRHLQLLLVVNLQ